MAGIALLLFAAAARADPPVAVLDVPLDERTTVAFDELVERLALRPDQNVRVVEIGRDAYASHHLVTLRTGEVLHRHDRHELTVVLLRGHGTQQIGDTTRPVGEGSVLYVPRGTPHAFTNGSSAPAVAYVQYSPPYDGEDRAPVD
jgi:mannose-6-phosphate isomerase-like protein (cupin superfamily)